MLVGKPRDSPLGSTFDIGLSGMRSTGKVRHRRPRSHVLGIATELLEPERPVGRLKMSTHRNRSEDSQLARTSQLG